MMVVDPEPFEAMDRVVQIVATWAECPASGGDHLGHVGLGAGAHIVRDRAVVREGDAERALRQVRTVQLDPARYMGRRSPSHAARPTPNYLPRPM